MADKERKHPLWAYNEAQQEREEADRKMSLEHVMHARALAVEIAANPGRMHEFLPREITPDLAQAVMIELFVHAEEERAALVRLTAAIEAVEVDEHHGRKARKAAALAVLRRARDQVEEPCEEPTENAQARAMAELGVDIVEALQAARKRAEFSNLGAFHDPRRRT